MRHRVALILLISPFLCAQDVLNQGVAAFKQANYQRAIELFREETVLHPNDVNGHLYLATAYMSMWIPGAVSPENEAIERSAETEFKRVLELDPNEKTALASLASIAYNSASALKGDDRTHKLDEAMDWNKRLAAIDPANKEAPYWMGAIAWARWYPTLMMKRAELGMKPGDAGPLPNPARQELKAQYSAMLDEGIANLDRALQIDPRYDDAMAYMNLLIRERADLRDTKEEYMADVAVADQWVQRVMDTKKAKAQSTTAPPPTPGPNDPVRVGSVLSQQDHLIKKVAPVYPPLAKEARIQGVVRFTIKIAKDGTIQNIQLVSGHPLLVPAAREALKQWIYSPTLLNGEPVEIIAPVDISFSLSQ